MQNMKKRSFAQQFLISQLKGMIIFNRQDLRPLGIVEGAVFRHENLHVAFFQCMVGGTTQYIRADQTAVLKNLLTVQAAECFGDEEDFIREKTTFLENCRLIGYKVCDANGKKIGHVEDCSIKLPLMTADRIYIRRPILKSLHQGSLIIQTSAILDVQPKKQLLTIQSEQKSVKRTAVKPITA